METMKVLHRPGKNTRVVRSALSIITPLTGDWFTKDVVENIAFDLHFQDMAAFYVHGRMTSFIVFTGMDGSVLITLMATARECHGRGYGTRLYQWFERYIRRRGCDTVRLQTVPGDINPNYRSTIAFYEKLGFVFTKRYNELWEHGAVEYAKKFSPRSCPR
jgi:GNAT superfamily N-acetyltransferase